MKTFAKFKGSDDNLYELQTYLIHVSNVDDSLGDLSVCIGGLWYAKYSDYQDFNDNWEII